MVVVFADDDVSEKSRPSHAPFDGSVGDRRYHGATLLARASVFDPRRLHAHERRRSVVALFGRLLADGLHRIAAARAGAQWLRRVQLNAFDRQMLRQLAATVQFASFLRFSESSSVLRIGDLFG